MTTPTTRINALFDGSSPDGCVLSGAGQARQLQFTGPAGYHLMGSGQLALSAGIVVAPANGTYTIDPACYLTADQTFSIAGGSTLELTGGIVGSSSLTTIGGGTLDVGAGAMLNLAGLTLEAGQINVRTGAISCGAAGGTINVQQGACLFVDRDTGVTGFGLAGSGRILANSAPGGSGTAKTLTLNGGAISPGQGAAAGILSVQGGLNLASSGTTCCSLGIDITGSGHVAGVDFDQLSVSGSLAGLGDNATSNLDLIVNISPGLSLAGESLPVICDPAMDFSGGSLGFHSVTWNSPGYAPSLSYLNGSINIVFPAAQQRLAGDINGDGLVDVADYNIWAANVGRTGATWSQGDLNGDGLVDVADYNIWAANVGRTAGAPEPVSMLMLAAGGGLFAIRRRIR
jgi:hypothetical protein